MSLLTSLIGYWKLDAASGTRIDSRGTNDLTDNNTVGSGTGKINSAANFTAASSEYLSHATNSDLETGDIDFTFSVWINLTTGSGTEILAKDTNSPGSSRDYTLDLNGLWPRFYINGGGTSIVQWGTAISAGTWYHIVAWHDSVNNQVGITVNNGTPVTATTGGEVPQTSTAQFRIGARQYSGFEGYWDGLIDEVGFWKRMLTSQDRIDLYNGGNGLAYSLFGGAQDTPELRLGRNQMRQLLAQ